MYDKFYGLSKPPFSPVPEPSFFFPGESIEAARAKLARCIERAEGVGMVVGPTGTGKTLLCRVLAEQSAGRLKVALVPSGRLASRRALLQAILYELGQPYRGMDEGELRLAVVDYVCVSLECPGGILLIVDEADLLPLRLIDELRILTNIAAGGQPRVRMVLAGGAALEERLTNPRLDAFCQRIVARCYLEALGRQETQQYIHARIRAAGGQPELLFPLAACEAVYQASNGVPRLINQICDHVLILAYAGRRQRIEPAYVQEAWADLQQLPTPWSNEVHGTGTGDGVIEFGSLGDAPGEAPPWSAATAPLAAGDVTPDAADDRGEPIAQLQRIAGLLAEAAGGSEPGEASEPGGGFEPGASIGPEVELVFQQGDDPFEEPFAEEEVIVDRFAPGAAASHPTPRRRFAEPSAAPPVEQAAERGADDRATRGEDAPPEGRPDECSDPRHRPHDAPTAQPDDEGAYQPDTLPLRAPVRASDRADAEPVLVIDEDEDSPREPRGRVAVARPRQYRQLFSRLRQVRA